MAICGEIRHHSLTTLTPTRCGSPSSYFSISLSFFSKSEKAKFNISRNGWFVYRVVPGHRFWQIEIAGWNWAGFFTEG